MGINAKKAEPSSEDGRRKMKQFIYYNASFIHSFIAQLEDGLPVLRSKRQEMLIHPVYPILWQKSHQH